MNIKLLRFYRSIAIIKVVFRRSYRELLQSSVENFLVLKKGTLISIPFVLYY